MYQTTDFGHIYAAGKSVENGGVNFSNTGFYCRKALQTSDVAGSTLDQSNTIFSGTDWQEIRFAEVMLNYAEAAAVLANWMKLIRNLSMFVSVQVSKLDQITSMV
jgi:hypothetical protein